MDALIGFGKDTLCVFFVFLVLHFCVLVCVKSPNTLIPWPKIAVVKLLACSLLISDFLRYCGNAAMLHNQTENIQVTREQKLSCKKNNVYWKPIRYIFCIRYFMSFCWIKLMQSKKNLSGPLKPQEERNKRTKECRGWRC